GGAAIGPYRLLRLLGAGGMGAVWLAERTDMLQGRQVALKLPRLLTGRGALAERLAREREILAALNHPNIARLYDAGLAADGQPYLALEYVEGERIDAYCARKGLDVPARLRLFLQVARAVAHAHAQLVVHRDLKPANVLVTEAGEVKLLDFGIAKLLEDGRAQETELTQLAGRALTPEYAAPEQILGQPIGTAADAYSLGVLLFELLTGARPYQLKRDSRAALEEAIVAAEPARPSSIVADAKLKKRLRGDLDTIVGKALKKSPGERYGTVEAFAQDIERHLERRPVRAQPDSRAYRVRKFVARNRFAVGAAASVLAAILVGAAVALWQARVAVEEKRRAEEIKDFVAAIFRDASPWTGPQRKLTAAELLKLAHGRVGQRFGDRPVTRIELLTTLGASLAGVGEAAEAESLLRAAIDDATAALGAAHALTLAARAELIKAMTLSGRTRERRAEIEAVLPLLERAPKRFAEQRVALLLNLADVLNDEGRYREVGETAARALELAQAQLGPSDPAQLNALQLIVNSYTNLGDLTRARDSAERLYRLARRIYPEPSRHPGLLDARFVYGRTLAMAGDDAAAIAPIEQSIADARAVFGSEDIRIAIYGRALTAPLLATGQLARALASAQSALRVLSAHYPPDSVHLAYALVAEASVQAAMRRPAAALEGQSRAVAILGQAIGDSADYTLHVRVQRAHSLAALGDSAAALRELDAIDAAHRAHGHPNRTRLVNWMAEARRLAGDHRGALAALDEAYGSTRPEGFAAFRPTAEFGLNRLALGDAEAARPDLEQALALHRRQVQQATPARADLWVGLGRAWLQLGQAARAQPALEDADAFWRAFDPDNRWAGEAAFWLARCYEALGRGGDAKHVYARAATILARSPLPGDAARLRFAQRASR
ncbi:MAG: serine/threonine-protein kinase, partial [Burkholderiaceae bacterium]|nr:serine/threonine-protein kinase [Burkholderiaceae bacterium]